MTETISSTKIDSTRRRRMAREPKAEDVGEVASANHAAATGDANTSPSTSKRQSKATKVLELMKRPEGATLEQLAAATGWLPHTTRAALTGLRKKGHAVTSDKIDGSSRVYRVVAG